jgi:capsular polysaccharide biosynthesis protein
MKQTLLFEKFRTASYSLLEKLSTFLPLWKEAEAIAELPPLLSVPVRRPQNISELPESFASHFIDRKHVPPRRLFSLEGVWISSEAVVFKNLRVFVPSLPWLQDLRVHRTGAMLAQQWLAPKSPFAPTAPPLALVWDQWAADNYYHWMIESLPRLLMVKRLYPECTFLVPKPAPAFIDRTLALMGISNTHKLRRHYDTALALHKLLIPELVYYYEERENPYFIAKAQTATLEKGTAPPPDLPLFTRQELIVEVRETLLSHYQKPARAKRRIYASRASQKGRRLQNEALLLPLLEKWGFEIVLFETLSFDEQLQLMLETEILLGIHGANLVNMLFLPPTAQVIELMNEAHFNEAYYLLASSLQLPYYAVPCKMADSRLEGETNKVLRNDADLLVPVQALEQTLQMCLQRVQQQVLRH